MREYFSMGLARDQGYSYSSFVFSFIQFISFIHSIGTRSTYCCLALPALTSVCKDSAPSWGLRPGGRGRAGALSCNYSAVWLVRITYQRRESVPTAPLDLVALPERQTKGETLKIYFQNKTLSGRPMPVEQAT